MPTTTYQTSAAAPSLGISQLDLGSFGDIHDSVNLYRGDVNFPFNLISLPGINGLDVDVTAFYSSNINMQVTTWNMEAPTGILGVGWAIPFEKVVVDRQNTGSNYNDAFYLVSGGSVLPLIRVSADASTISFQLQEYEFWTVTYFPNPGNPTEERWEIVKEGTTYIYGLGGIEWGVKWGNWIGSSTNDAGEQYPQAWDLVEVRNIWGESVFFEYDYSNYSIGASTSAQYTRSSRLKTITCPDQRTITFNYREKYLFENQLPFTPPNNAPGNAFQFQYEEQYLNTIDVTNEHSELLFTIVLTYDFYNVAPGRLATNDSYKKRYLRSVFQQNSDGAALPGFQFDYYTSPTDTSPGALQAITYPEGGRAEYTYTALPLADSSTRYSIKVPDGYIPRVWHGVNYTVVGWYAQSSEKLRLSVYTWAGKWNSWEDTALADISINDFNVLTSSDFFLVTYKDDATSSYRACAFKINEHQLGKWEVFEPDIGAGFSDLSATAGRNFFVMASISSASLIVYQWDVLQHRWLKHRFPIEYDANQAYLYGNNNFFFATYYNETYSTLTIQQYYADADMHWIEGGGHTILDVQQKWQMPIQNLISVGDWFAEVTYIAEGSGNQILCLGVVLWWDEDFKNLWVDERPQYSQDQQLNNPLFLPVAAGSMLANAQHVSRYDGEDFKGELLLSDLNPGTQYRYMYGTDLAIAAQWSGSSSSYTLFDFDPYQLSWVEETDATIVSGDEDDQQLALPSASGDYRVVGRDIAYRDSSLQWNSIFTLPNDADLQTIQNRAPFYIAYENADTRDTYILFLKDGNIDGQPYQLKKQHIYTGSGGSGTTLAGTTSFITFEGESLDEATALHLCQVVNNAISEQQIDYPVTCLTTNDGYQSLSTYYIYDADTATFDPYGKVAQYTRVKIYRGSSGGQHGYIENTYFNGLSPDVAGVEYPPTDAFTNVRDYYSLVNGQLFTSSTYDSLGRKVAGTTNYLYAYDRIQMGSHLAGAYICLRKQEERASAYVFDLPATFERDLNAGDFSQAMRAAFQAKGFVFSNDVSVLVEAESLRWLIADRQLSKEYAVVADNGALQTYTTIVKIAEMEYNTKAQLARTTTYNTDSIGQTVQSTEDVRYGWEVYPNMEQLNLLAPVVQRTSTNQTQSLTTDIAITTYQQAWSDDGSVIGWAPHKTYEWDGTAGTEQFDFAAWSGNGEPAQGWVKTSEVIAISSNGLPLEVADIDRIHRSTLYDQSKHFVVAQFANASLTGGEASYYGFEAYEDDQGWSIVPEREPRQQYITTGDAYTGTRRLLLPGNPTAKVGLHNTFYPQNGAQKFVLSCWVKTQPGFAPTPSLAGWEITGSGVSTDAADIQQTLFVPIPATDGAWQYFYTLIDPAQFGVASLQSIALFVFNQQNQKYLLVDDISFAPFLGDCTASVFEQRYRLPTASIDMFGRSKRFAYDYWQRPVAEISDGHPTSLAAAYLWRQGQQTFDPASPNSRLSIAARTGGLFEDFHHGEEWQQMWQASAGWSVIDQRLVYAGGQPGTITLRDTGINQSYGVRFSIAAAEPVDRAIGVAIGNSAQVRWMNHSWEIYDVASGHVVDMMPQPVLSAHDWLVIVGAHGVLLFADGKQVLQYAFTQPVSGVPTIFTANKIALDYIIVVTDPVSDISYLDNAGQTIQSQTLDDADSIVAANCLDVLGRAAIRTKPARFSNALFGYRSSFVQSIDWTTGVMVGDIATYYPDDEGYPYSRTRFDSSPLSRVLESGAPGKALAIDLTIPESARHTTLYRTSANIQDGLADDLPAGEYLIQTIIDPDKVPTLQLADKAGNTIVAQQGDPVASPTAFAKTRNTYDSYGNLQLVQLPNAFQEHIVDRGQFVVRMAYDFFGRLLSKQVPDSNMPFRYVYDQAGRIRFMQDANGAQAQYILYWIYDSLGRMIEEGSCDAVWDVALLSAHANDKTWLPSTGIWSKRYAYDGDGSDKNTIGRLAAVAVNNSGLQPQADVMELFKYSTGGKVVQKSVKVLAYDDGAEHVSQYAYDKLGNTTQVIYDAENGASAFSVAYEFDRLGHVSAVVGAGQASATTYATYQYAADGAVTSEIFSPGTNREVVRQYSYAPAGWLTQAHDRFFTEKLEYTANGYDGARYYTGKIARESSTFTIPNAGQFTTSYAYQYAYDQLGRLQVARNDQNDAWSLGVGQPLTYDANGNAVGVQRGSVSQQYIYNAGTNTLKNASGSSDQDYLYNANGNVVAATPRGISQITYDRMSQMAVGLSMQSGDTTLAFQYDGGDTRVLKQQPGQSKLYLLSVLGNPLIEKTSAAGAETSAFYIYGPTGRFAIQQAGTLYTLLRDHEGSTRAVFDGATIGAAYNYLPFGDFMGAIFEPGGRITAYLYTGQELDGETGLYNDNARFYDSYLGRFYSADPAGEFASPYIYVGNDPIDFDDPTGAFPWAAVATLVGGLLLAAAGAALALFTAGGSTPLIVAGTTLMSGATTAIAGAIAGSLAVGAGLASAGYAATHFKNFKWSEWGISVSLGAAFGAVSGGIGGGLAAFGVSAGIAFGIETLAGIGVGALDSFVTNGALNKVNDRSFYDNWGTAVAIGAGLGLLGGLPGGLGRLRARGAAEAPAAPAARNIIMQGVDQQELYGGANTLWQFAGRDVPGPAAQAWAPRPQPQSSPLGWFTNLFQGQPGRPVRPILEVGGGQAPPPVELLPIGSSSPPARPSMSGP